MENNLNTKLGNLLKKATRDNHEQTKDDKALSSSRDVLEKLKQDKCLSSIDEQDLGLN